MTRESYAASSGGGGHSHKQSCKYELNLNNRVCNSLANDSQKVEILICDPCKWVALTTLCFSAVDRIYLARVE